MDQLRNTKVDSLSTRQVDHHQRQLKNVGPGSDPNDVVTVQQLTNALAVVNKAAQQQTNSPVNVSQLSALLDPSLIIGPLDFLLKLNTDAAGNVIKNPSFENQTDSWGTNSGSWSVVNDNTIAQSGSYYAKIPAASFNGNFQVINVQAGQVWVIRAWVRTDATGNGSANLYTAFYDTATSDPTVTAGTFISDGFTAGVTGPQTTWTEIIRVVTVPSNGKSILIIPCWILGSPTTGNWYLDNVRAYPVTDMNDILKGNGLTGSGNSLTLNLGNGVTFSGTSLVINNGNGLTFSGGQVLLNLGNGLIFTGSAVKINNGNGLNFSGSSLQVNLGNGLTFSGTAVQANLGNGLTFSGTSIVANLGNGLTISGSAIAVNNGNGISVSGGTVAVNFGNGLTLSGSALVINNGGGLNFSTGALQVDAGSGISLISLQVAIPSNGVVNAMINSGLAINKLDVTTGNLSVSGGALNMVGTNGIAIYNSGVITDGVLLTPANSVSRAFYSVGYVQADAGFNVGGSGGQTGVFTVAALTTLTFKGGILTGHT